jgi:hypothetical protein
MQAQEGAVQGGMSLSSMGMETLRETSFDAGLLLRVGKARLKPAGEEGDIKTTS